MDIAAMLRLLPTIMKAVEVVQGINESRRSGASIFATIQEKGPEVLALVQSVGHELFPTLPIQEQVQAATVRLDPALTKRIQIKLNELGAKPQLVEDGAYGRNTKAAVVAYQEKNGLEPDGWAGPLTLAKLGIK
jgi:peptidoglycan hydrolase-like protein with peptidoglycan-binding domain